MLRSFLYRLTELIARIHEKILSLNDSYELAFSDKMLHFLVIGMIGMALLLVIHPLFQWLAKKRCVIAISWLYVFTLIIVLTFAIEIGQRVSHTGDMEFADIVSGIGGFLLMFLVFLGIRAVVKLIGGAIDDHRKAE